MPSVPSESPRRRLGGRSSRVRRAVLDATLAELGDVGLVDLTLEGVARRAGVHKTTIYRRWGTRERLVLEAMLEQARVGVPVPDTGSLRSDLLTLGHGAARTVATPQSQAVVRTVIALGPQDPSVAQASRAFWAERLAMDGAIVERAVTRGAVPPDTVPQDVIEAVLGPIYFRVLVTSEPVDASYVQRVVDRVVAGISTEIEEC